MAGEFQIDALLPADMAAKAEQVGVKQGQSSTGSICLRLAMLAGAFIALGAIFATTVSAGSMASSTPDGAAAFSTGLPYGVVRLLSGLVFSLGLILVIVGGAELFTGNNLIVMAWANRKVSTSCCSRTGSLFTWATSSARWQRQLLMYFTRAVHIRQWRNRFARTQHGEQ